MLNFPYILNSQENRFMNRMETTSALLLLLAIVFFGNSILADSEGLIKYRKNVMKSTRDHMGAIADILKNRLPLQAHFVDHAKSIFQNSKMTLSMFPKGSHFGDTKAKPTIWENWSKFEAATKAFVSESDKLVKLAESGNIETFAKQIRATSKTCGRCHKHFRKRE